MTTTLLQEESAVRSVLDRIYAAWADNDANAFVAPYPAPASRALETWVLSRTTGSWRVEAFHNCPAGPRETEA
jgi:hypothetical protein